MPNTMQNAIKLRKAGLFLANLKVIFLLRA